MMGGAEKGEKGEKGVGRTMRESLLGMIRRGENELGRVLHSLARGGGRGCQHKRKVPAAAGGRSSGPAGGS